MNLTPQQKEQYAKRFLAVAKVAIVENGHVSFDEIWFATEPLATEMMKNPNIKALINKDEVFSIVYDEIRKLCLDQDKDKKFKLAAKVSLNEFEAAAERFVIFIEGLPYEHYFYFPLPIKLPENISQIKLTPNVQLLKPKIVENETFKTNQFSTLGEMLAGKTSITEAEDDVFCKVKVYGYGQSAQAEAISILKQFLYLSEESHLLRSPSWQRQYNNTFEKSKFKIPAKQSGLLSFNLPKDLATYLSGITINQERFKDFDPSQIGQHTLLTGYQNYEEFYERRFLADSINFISLQDEKRLADREHIFSAIEWGFDGSANANKTMGFIQVCIGLEALLGDKSVKEISLTEKLADRCAYLLGKTPTERKDFSTLFKEIYDLRSKLVHGVQRKVSEDHSVMLLHAEFILERLVYREIELSSKKRITE